MIKWAILLYGLSISGGANVIFNHALFARQKGVDITIVSQKTKTYRDTVWHEGTQNFNYKTLEQASLEKYDVAIATEWRSAYDVGKITAKKYVYFVQSIESKFFKNPDSFLAYVANQTYHLPLETITEATWINKYLKKYYKKNATIVLNGVDKNIFKAEGKYISARSENKIRFLIEGSVSSWFKNVYETIDICRLGGADEIWLVTPDEVDSVDGVDKVFSQVPMSDMPSIYRSCDVLVKLSLVEGMFGPPLEMFCCGGTAIVYDIEGSEEYIKDGYNALIVTKNDKDGAIKAIQSLIKDKILLSNLKRNALKTADNWMGWDISSNNFYNTIDGFSDTNPEDVVAMKKECEEGAKIYNRAEKYLGTSPVNNRISQLVSLYVQNKSDIYLYGAGNYCKNTIVLLSEYEVPIKGIIVSIADDNPQTVFGHPVYTIDKLQETIKDALIYITTEKYYKEIETMLKEKEMRYII